MHLDAAYNLSQMEYPITLVGVSDCTSPFHLVAVLIFPSKLTTTLLRRQLCYGGRIPWWPTSSRFVKADADKAQRNDATFVLGGEKRHCQSYLKPSRRY